MGVIFLKLLRIITLIPYLMLNKKSNCFCVDFHVWIGSQGSGMIIIVGMSSGPFVNAVAQHLPTPLRHPQWPLKVAAHPNGKNSTLRSEVTFRL